MAEEKFLTVRDVAIVLGVSEKEVVDLVESGALPAYKIGGVYLRFKKEQIQEFKKNSHPLTPKVARPLDYTFSDRLSDFFYFNDFYIIAIALVVLLLCAIFLG